MEEKDMDKPFNIVAVSDRGSVRQNNEDYFGIFDPETDELMERRGVLAVVADGMGGHFSGSKASRAAVEVVGDAYYRESDEEAVTRLEAAVKEANATVFETVGEGRKGLAGTTCTAAALFPDRLHIAHVGDSRAYLVHEGKISQLTEDHSLVGEMIRRGSISKEKAMNHPRRNVITRAVGFSGKVEIDIYEAVPIQGGDSVLLCSDGLFTMLEESEILKVASTMTPNDACAELVKLAKSKGGEDNITIVIARRN